ncbi:unnamed protein product [Pedinophyceae sp. YPF-701]|nr:unnamed protein product [Pedinophyceae sp. YPF-701]
MGAKKAPPQELETREPLLAVLLADSYDTDLRPMSLETPKALLPVANTPMIEYSLEWLAMSGVDEVLVMAAAGTQGDAVEEFITGSEKWSKQRVPKVTVLRSGSSNIGDALRYLDEEHLVRSDFVLTYADVVTNVDLQPAIQAHLDRRAKDKQAIMTAVVKPAASVQQRLRFGEAPHWMVLDGGSQRLLQAELQPRRGGVGVNTAAFSERDAVRVRGDLHMADIYVCAPEVLMLFSDNWDYEDVARDFIPGTLSAEELGNTLHVYEARTHYAVRIQSLRAYDAVCRDVIGRWAFPLVLDTNALSGEGGRSTSYVLKRRNVYREEGSIVALDVECFADSVVATGCTVAAGVQLEGSVVGQGAFVGAGARLIDCIVHSGARVEEGAKLTRCVVCTGAVVRAGAVIEPGCVITPGVVIGSRHTVAAGSKVTLCCAKERLRSALGSAAQSDNEDEATEKASGSDGWGGSDDASWNAYLPPDSVVRAAQSVRDGCMISDVVWDREAVGADGAGFLWPEGPGSGDGYESGSSSTGWDFYSAAGVRPDLAVPSAADHQAVAAWLEELRSDAIKQIVQGPGTAQAAHPDAPADAQSLPEDPEVHFKREVVETFLRCAKDGFDQANVVVELNGLRLAENRTFADCARYIFTTVLGLSCPAPPGVAGREFSALYPTDPPDTATKAGRLKLLAGVRAQLKKWKGLVEKFARGEDEQVDLLLTLEEFCSEEGVFSGTGEYGAALGGVFQEILQLLYSTDVVSEDALLAWADEKAQATEDERVWLNRAGAFIEWLKESDEEDDDDDDDEEDDD